MANEALAKYEQICRQVANNICAEHCSEPKAVAGLGQPNTPQCAACMNKEFAECLRNLVGGEAGGDKGQPPSSQSPYPSFIRKRVDTPLGEMELWQAIALFGAMLAAVFWIVNTFLIRFRGR